MRAQRVVLLLSLLLLAILFIVPHAHAQDGFSPNSNSIDPNSDDPQDPSTDTSGDPSSTDSSYNPAITDTTDPSTNVQPDGLPAVSMPQDPGYDNSTDVANNDCVDPTDTSCNSTGVAYPTPIATDTAPDVSDGPFPFVMVDKDVLETNKKNMYSDPDQMLQDTLFYLHYYAREYAFSNVSRSTVYDVTSKQELAPSNSSHDYLSLARYFWPNNKTVTGLPYVRRDGFVNPEINLAPDYTQFHNMLKALSYLSYAYFFYSDEDFASVAVDHIEAWFINNETRMNPHLQYASLIRGYDTGRAKGVIDFHILPDLITAISILQSSSHWKPGTNAALRQWFTQYRQWLFESPNGKTEASSLNNHGTWYDVQYVTLSIFLNDTDTAVTYVKNCTGRIDAQILATGQLPLETARPFSYFYTCFDTIGLFQLATLAQRVGVDLFNYVNPAGGSMKKALDYLMPFIPDTTTSKSSWPYINTDGYNATYDLPAVLDQAYIIYGDPAYHEKSVLISKSWSYTSNLTRLSQPWEQFGQPVTNLEVANGAQSTYHFSIFSAVAILAISLVNIF